MKVYMWLSALLFAGVAFGQPATNLVTNPSLEDLTPDGFAAGWKGGEFGKPGTNVLSESKYAHSGKRSVRVGTSPGSFVTCAAAPIVVKPQTTYFLSWWCKTEGLDFSRAYVFLQTNKGQRVVPNDSQYGTQDWAQHFGQYTTTAEETLLYPILTTQHTTGPAAQAYFDDIGLYEGRFPEPLFTTYQGYQRNLRGESETAVLLSKTRDFTLWADDLAARIYQDDELPGYAKAERAVRLSGARGEQVYAQLALRPTTDLANVRLTHVDATLQGVARVQCRPVGYANLKTAHRPSTRLGLTPDPLLRDEPVALKANETACFLVSVTIPRTARAGSMTERMALKAGDKTLATVALNLRVYDFTLPPDPTFRTLITYSASSFRPWDKRSLDLIEHDIAGVLAAHGVRGNGATAEVPAKLVDGQVVCDFTAFDQRVQWFIDNLRFNAFFLGPCFGGGTSEGWQKHRKWLDMEPLSEDFNRLFPQYLKQVGQHLREKGWLDMAYLYLWDEPEPDYFDKVVALQRLALQGDPGFKIWETTSPNYEAFHGVVKAWSIPFGRPYFSETSVDKRRAAGDEIWVYNIPATLEAAPQLHRVWFWQAARYGAVGAQLWQTTFYNKIDPWEDITPEPWVTGRNQESRYVYDAGEAILLYPDKQGGPPLPTLRLKLLQKGIDDFEYLTILQQRLTAKVGAEQAQAELRKLASQVVKDLGNYNMDTLVLRAAREETARRIEALEQRNGGR